MSLSPTLLAECEALTSGAGFVDVSDRTKIELRGDDRASFLHNFCTNDIKRLQPGQGCEAFICNVKGHVLGHVHVYCGVSSLWLDTVPGQAEKLVKHLDRYLIREKVEILDRTDDLSAVLVSGSASVSIRTLEGEVSIWESTIASNACHIATFPASQAEAMLGSCRSSALECSREALDIVRIENGYPLYGLDIREENLPQEVGRDRRAISFTKGCYLGQETVARIDALGHVNKQLCGVAFSGEVVPPGGTELVAAGKVVGTVTSACWSPKLGRPLALAYVRRGHHEPGSSLSSDYGGGAVVPLPLG
jgi:folate-binding protein YgfZ